MEKLIFFSISVLTLTVILEATQVLVVSQALSFFLSGNKMFVLRFGLENQIQLNEHIIILSIVLIVVLLTFILGVLSLVAQNIMGAQFSNRIGNLLLEKHTSLEHLNEETNISEVIKVALVESQRTNAQVIVPLTHIISRILFLIIILTMLFLINIILLYIVILLTTVFIILFTLLQPGLSRNGLKITNLNSQRASLIRDTIQLKHDFYSMRVTKQFLKLFSTVSSKMAKSQIILQTLVASPRIFIDALILLCLVFAAITISKSSTIFHDFITLNDITFLMISLYKIIPSFQKIYHSLSDIRGNSTSLDSVKALVMDSPKKIEFKNRLISKDISVSSFQLSDDKKFKEFSAKFKPNIISLIRGPSGCGKTTLLKIIAGIPMEFTGKVSAPEDVALVPQDISFLSGTLRQNILLMRGQELPISRALEIACVSDFLSNTEDLERKLVGEFASFSGGQLQRIGIARALIGNPRVLLLDESVSGLDKTIKLKLLKNLLGWARNQADDKFIIIVSHDVDVDQVEYEEFSFKLNQND